MTFLVRHGLRPSSTVHGDIALGDVDAAMSMMDRPRVFASLPRRTALTYLAVGLLAMVAYLAIWPHAPVMAGDSPSYLNVARDLSDGTIDRLHDRAPGYPLFLIALGSTAQPTRALFVVTLLLHLASIWILGATLYAAGVRERLLVLFGALLVLPPATESAAYVMTETLAQFLLVVGVAALLAGIARGRARWPLVVAAAIALALAALTRPTYQAIAPVVLVTLVLIAIAARSALSLGRAIAAGLVLVIGAVAILGAYAAANRAATGFFGITPMMGLNLSTRTVSVIERLPEEYAVAREILIRSRDTQLVESGSSHTGYSFIHDARPALARATGLEGHALSAYMLRLNLQLIRAAPLQYLEEVARACAVYWFPSARELAIMGSRRVQLVWVVLHFALLAWFALQLAVVTGGALLQVARRVRGADGGAVGAWLEAHLFGTTAYAIAAVMVFYTMLLSCLFDVGDTRQRVPTDAFLLFMTILGGQWWARTAQSPLTRARES